MDNRLKFLVFIFFLAFGVFTTSVFYASSQRQSRAENRVPTETICLAQTLSAEVGEKVMVNCFVRDQDKRAIPKTECCFTPTLGSASPQCNSTDPTGKTSSDITSDTVGVSTVTCSSGEIISTTSIEFTSP